MVAVSNFFVLVPLYIYPNTGSWTPLFNAIGNDTNLNFKVVVNPSSGPGYYDTVPDTNYISNIAQLNTYSNVDVLGYVYLNYGARLINAIEADVATYNYWGTYKAKNIALDGIFFDQAPASTLYTNYLTSLASYTRSESTLGNQVFLNPGGPVPASFYSIADYINAYEATPIVNLGLDNAIHVINVTIPAADKAQSSAIVYGYPDSTTQLKADVATLIGEGIGGLFVTSDYDFQSFSAIWSSFVADVAADT